MPAVRAVEGVAARLGRGTRVEKGREWGFLNSLGGYWAGGD
jgi:hypothetical protein